MEYHKLAPELAEALDDQPETFMGIHILKTSRPELIVILGGEIEVRDRTVLAQADRLPGFIATDETASTLEARKQQYEEWKDSLAVFTGVDGHKYDVLSRLGFYKLIHGPLPNPPKLPFPPYGHLPFHGVTGTANKVLRWEPFPTSRRVKGNVVSPGTYCAPVTEDNFVAVGFNAVGRFAMPSLLPACFKWTFDPPAGIAMRCGASVPLYGQAGGGVEIEFPTGFTQGTTIPSPKFIKPI